MRWPVQGARREKAAWNRTAHRTNHAGQSAALPLRRSGRQNRVTAASTSMGRVMLCAAGAHVILFTTGRGTPFGAPAPTMKLATNTPLATKKSTWIDFNAGVVADGKKTLDEAARDLMALVLEVCSGKKTRAEEKGFREISIFKDGVVL